MGEVMHLPWLSRTITVVDSVVDMMAGIEQKEEE